MGMITEDYLGTTVPASRAVLVMLIFPSRVPIKKEVV